MNVTIFSKDRACQLDLLLRSIRDLTDIGLVNVIYTASNAGYLDGYEKLIGMRYHATYINEVNFKPDVIGSINEGDNKIMFLTDDAVFKSEFNIDSASFDNPKLACVSLMLGANITWAYEEERAVTQPTIPEWEWQGKDIDFNYPMSVIGHIWRTSDVYPKIVNGSYDKAYNIESSLRDNPIQRSLMRCFEESKVVHIANNVVSPIGNKSGGQSVSDLNDKYLNNQRIKWEYIDNNSVHFEKEYSFEKVN
jgi:hypothetical protein